MDSEDKEVITERRLESVKVEKLAAKNINNICAAPRTSKGHEDEVCKNLAGMGTDHLGTGRCKHHLTEEDEAHAIQVIKDTQAVQKTNGTNGNGYAIVIEHGKLSELYELEEDNKAEMDNIDHEIHLMRAMIKLAVGKFGQKMVLDEDGDLITGDMTPQELKGDIVNFVSLINSLSSSIKRKYEVYALAGEMIPRATVRQYMAQVTILLNTVLENRCTKCGHFHNLREQTISSLNTLTEL